jgi:hypothetical protein
MVVAGRQAAPAAKWSPALAARRKRKLLDLDLDLDAAQLP